MKLIIELKDETYKFYKENALILIARGNGRILASEVYEAIKNGKPYDEADRWIPVSERLPEESLNSVIGWDAYRERCVFVQYIDGHFQITGSDESFNIVAWKPLPEPYESETENLDYQRAVEDTEYCERHEPTYNPDDGSM